MTDIAKHGDTASCWTAINANVYDVTDFVNRHPGGAQRIISLCGVDGSFLFNRQHGGSSYVAGILALYKIGVLK
jgi:cytochrome b involved in lipid metabolism